MARPKTKPYQLTLRVSENDWIKLTNLADELATPRTILISRAISNYLARFYPEKKSAA